MPLHFRQLGNFKRNRVTKFNSKKSLNIQICIRCWNLLLPDRLAQLDTTKSKTLGSCTDVGVFKILTKRPQIELVCFELICALNTTVLPYIYVQSHILLCQKENRQEGIDIRRPLPLLLAVKLTSMPSAQSNLSFCLLSSAKKVWSMRSQRNTTNVSAATRTSATN